MFFVFETPLLKKPIYISHHHRRIHLKKSELNRYGANSTSSAFRTFQIPVTSFR